MVAKLFNFIAITFILVNALDDPQKKWNVPAIERPKQRDTAGRPLRIAVTALMPGLSMLKQRDVARGLSEEGDKDGQPLFNVTLLASK